MADLNDPLKDSYIGKVADALGPYTTELKDKGFDPASRITQLTGAGPLIEGAGKARKSAEKALADAVKNEQDLRAQFYKLATDTVSLVEGLAGKGHEAARPARGPHRQPDARRCASCTHPAKAMIARSRPSMRPAPSVHQTTAADLVRLLGDRFLRPGDSGPFRNDRVRFHGNPGRFQNDPGCRPDAPGISKKYAGRLINTPAFFHAQGVAAVTARCRTAFPTP